MQPSDLRDWWRANEYFNHGSYDLDLSKKHGTATVGVVTVKDEFGQVLCERELWLTPGKWRSQGARTLQQAAILEMQFDLDRIILNATESERDKLQQFPEGHFSGWLFSEQLRQDITAWLDEVGEERCVYTLTALHGSRHTVKHQLPNVHRLAASFYDDADAMLFKLTWG